MASSGFTVHQSTLSELQGASAGIPGLCSFALSSVCRLRKVLAKDGSPGTPGSQAVSLGCSQKELMHSHVPGV